MRECACGVRKVRRCALWPAAGAVLALPGEDPEGGSWTL